MKSTKSNFQPMPFKTPRTYFDELADDEASEKYPKRKTEIYEIQSDSTFEDINYSSLDKKIVPQGV